MAQHPEFALEAQRVRDTAERARREGIEAREQLIRQTEKVTQLFADSKGDDGSDESMELIVAHNILSYMKQRSLYLSLAQEKPYFSRVDFTEQGNDQKNIYYIGKWGLMDQTTNRPYVVDWRSPVADLYYNGQVGAAEYRTPGGVVCGDMSLKRIITCENGVLVSLVDADIIAQDQYLNSILSDHASDRLKDIVTTIQAEQNVILRHDRARPVIVQGVAGAGKTTVALHRITWLLYTYQDTMAPRNLMVIAPNPLFLNYISAVLPDLGVEDVIQETLHGLTARLCGVKLPPLQDADTLLALIDPAVSGADKEMLTRVARFKGSMEFKACVQAYLDYRTRQMLPEGDVLFGSVRLYSHNELEKIYCRDLSPFPVDARGKELAKHMKERVESAAHKLALYLQAETEKRTNLLRTAMPRDSVERQARMARIYQNRDERLKQVDELRKGFIRIWTKQLPVLKLMEEYRRFLDVSAPFGLPEGVDPVLWSEVCRTSLERLDGRHMDSGDLPALLVLQKNLFGLRERLDIHHTVIDEAQDLSPFMFDMLMELCHNASFTIVGDLNQGIHSYRGVTDWTAMTGEVFGEGSTDYYELITSYRNTVEIMNFASQVALKHPYPGQQAAKPVLRHGSKPRVLPASRRAAADIANEIARLKAEGCQTIAVIEKLPEDCKKLYQKLKPLVDGEIRLLRDEDAEYTGGVMVLPAHLSKGLEFDAVIVANANRENWPDDVLHARLLFVCLTRPLHHLTLFYQGEPSALLPEAES